MNKILSYGFFVVLFFSLSFGFGYSSLNRYDSRFVQGISDARAYSHALDVEAKEISWRWRYRLMIPGLAEIPYAFLKGKSLGSWDIQMLCLLFANSLCMSLAGLLLLYFATTKLKDSYLGLLAAFLFLSNHVAVNYYYPGMVGASEALMTLLVTFSLMLNRPLWVLFLAPIGALSKEAFVPISAAAVTAWMLYRWKKDGLQLQLLFYPAMFSILGLLSLCFIRFAVDGAWVWPWEIRTDDAQKTLLEGFILSFSDKSFYYGFLTLIPLGVLGARKLPSEYVWPGLGALAMGILLGCKQHVEGFHMARFLYNAAGPIISLWVAYQIMHILKGMNLQDQSKA